MTLDAKLPSTRVSATPYRRPRPLAPDSLRLDGNEGSRPSPALLAAAAELPIDRLRDYPDLESLRRKIAARHRVAPERVVVTAGADDAMDRVFRAYVEPGREVVVPVPTFEMIHRFAANAGAVVRTVDWRRAFPLDEIRREIGARTALVVAVSPNNPTGAVVTAGELRELARAATGSIVLFDHVYAEYADEDLTAAALELDNVVVLRTLSKAWGLAGCRVGYALAAPPVAAVLHASGNPYPVAAPSAAIALRHLTGGDAEMRAHVETVRHERSRLGDWLAARGVEAPASQGNFLLAELGGRARFVERALKTLGVVVRSFPHRAEIAGGLRISLPGDDEGFARLLAALDTALAPQALLFDLDGVLADVRDSYRRSIVDTAAFFSVALTDDDVRRAKLAGNANDDWELTRALLAERGVEVSLEEVTRRFQTSYLGDGKSPGRRENERLLAPQRWIERLARRLPLAIVTGRPRAEAEWFLDRFALRPCFSALIAREDAPAKPDPAPVRRVLAELAVERAWMVGDTPDDVAAAGAAGVVPLAVPAPGDESRGTRETLWACGAAVVLATTTDLENLL